MDYSCFSVFSLGRTTNRQGQGALSVWPKFSVQPVEMQVEQAGPLEIFRNKLATFRVTSLFPSALVGTEITVHSQKIFISAARPMNSSP